MPIGVLTVALQELTAREPVTPTPIWPSRSGSSSILPFLGTIVGGCGGLMTGATIGLAVAAFAAVSWKWFPASPELTSLRERLCWVGVIWVLALLSGGRGRAWTLGVAPALLGTPHALLAGLRNRTPSTAEGHRRSQRRSVVVFRWRSSP